MVSGGSDNSGSQDALPEKSLEVILDEAGSPVESLASGSAAALTLALAAALTCSALRALDGGPEVSGYAVQAENLRMRAVSLIDRNRTHFEAARQALKMRLADPGFRDHRIGESMKDTLETLGIIANTGADTAELSATVTEIASEDFKPDTASAAVLAESASRVAVTLIRVNLITSSDHPVLATAEAELESAVAFSNAARELIA